MAEFGMWLTWRSPPALTFTAILVCFSLHALEGVSDKYYLFLAGVTTWRGPSHQGGHKPMPLPPFIPIMAHYMSPVENVSICGLWEIKTIISCETWHCIQYFYCTWVEQCSLHPVSLQPLDGSKGKSQTGGQAIVFLVLRPAKITLLSQRKRLRMQRDKAEMHKNVYFLLMQFCEDKALKLCPEIMLYVQATT